MSNLLNINLLLGKKLSRIDRNHDEMEFTTTSGEVYKMHHTQNCCETVYIEDICGDLDNLIESPLLIAEKRTNRDTYGDPIKRTNRDTYGDRLRFPIASHDSYTWTFYELATIKGSVTIRWFGSSNGYYSEEVSFEQIV